MTIYAGIILALHIFALIFSDADDKGAAILGTATILPLIGRILGWW